MSRKNSRSDSIDVCLTRSRTSSYEYQRSNSIGSRSMSIGSIGSIESISLDYDTTNTTDNPNIVIISNGRKTRKRDVYLNSDMKKTTVLEPSPTPSSYLIRIMSKFTKK
jgi:glycyl-tRNA synthetase (class II)